MKFGAESRKLPVRTRSCTDSGHETDSPADEPLCRFREGFDHERIVSEIRDRMMRQQAEENDNWPFEQNCRRNCALKRWIIECTLRSAHPVHDASTSWINGRRMTHHDAWIGGELVERGHDFAFSDREKFRGQIGYLTVPALRPQPSRARSQPSDNCEPRWNQNRSHSPCAACSPPRRP